MTMNSNQNPTTTIMRAGSAPPTRGRSGYNDSPKVRTKPYKKAGNGAGVPPIIPRKTTTTPNHKKAVKRTVLQREEYDYELAQRQRSSCSLAMSRTETILVSASGDVICCRCRRSSTPFLSRSDSEGLEAWTIMPCCDTDACLDIAGQSDSPWSPVFDKLRSVNGNGSDTANGNRTRNSNSKRQQQQQQQQFVDVPDDSFSMSMYEWEKVDKPNPHIVTRQGLLGGAMAMPTPPKQTPIRPPPSQQPSLISPSESASFTSSLPSDYDGGIMALPSFDYSHIHEQDHNDMVPPGELNNHNQKRQSSFSFPTIPETVAEEKKEDSARRHTTPDFVHGVPTFLATLSQIRITQVSAHPLGAHVLLISAEALLFTYGLNNHGQLGMGTKSNVKDRTRGFSTTPTIITPLLENGGKAIHCAAGVDHSLVVVSTEGRRIQKLTRSTNNNAYSGEHGALAINRVTSYPTKLSYEEVDHDLNTQSSEEQDDDSSVQHHQVYAFGSNDFKKLGLVSAAEDQVDEDVLLPRRVALHCTVWPQQKQPPHPKGSTNHRNMPPPGIFQVEASSEHSAALVRRATGDIEVYMWGNATLGALGLPLQPETTPVVPNRSRPTTTANNIFPLPTVLESLSCRRPTSETTSTEIDFPIQIALGSYCSFVVMSSGKAFSFGFSAEGMLGQGGGMTHTMSPQQVCMPANSSQEDGGIVSISAGAYHTLCLTESGKAYSWGISSNARLGLGEEKDLVKSPKSNHQHSEGVVLEWMPQPISVPTTTPKPTTKTGDADVCRVLQVCAGYDSSLLIMRSGSVLSFGKRSGRLGLGEVASDVASPKPMFGGLRLFTNVASLRKKCTES